MIFKRQQHSLTNKFVQRTWKHRRVLCLPIAVFLLSSNFFFRIASFLNNRNPSNDFILADFANTSGLLMYQYTEHQNETYPSETHMCPITPTKLIGGCTPNFDKDNPPSWSEIGQKNMKVVDGGSFSPEDCKVRHRTAIIIPLRNRDSQAKIFLSHMHPIWQRQQIDYKVYLITQHGNGPFNRAKLLNIGFAEASKERWFNYYVFHDVDLLAEDDRCFYRCSDDNPRHISELVNTFSYVPLSYFNLCRPWSSFLHMINVFGGVSMMSQKQFLHVNGYSNLYWGWGGEDDDMHLRLWNKGYDTSNHEENACRFQMIGHTHEAENSVNGGRNALVYYAISRMEREGLNTLRYRIVSRKAEKLFTNITVDVGEPNKKMKEFLSEKYWYMTECSQKMPWIR